MVDVTKVRAPARHLPFEQLGAFALDEDALVKLGHVQPPSVVAARVMKGTFDAQTPISPIASSDVGYKLD
jgi:hypothetical protein